jgi:UDP-N-acetylmuramoyl-L-alanyl-D-glutamate--2,6-diaminopimelate ligase
MIELHRIGERIRVRWKDYRETQVGEIRQDSRDVKPGDLFVAIRGTRADGEAFLEDAVRRGAAAVIAENDCRLSSPVPFGIVPCAREALARLSALRWGDPARRLVLFGITGTNGKTTTSFLLAHILRKAGHPTAVIGTTGCYDARGFRPVSNTTPGPPELHEILADFADRGSTHAVMEVSSHALVQKRTVGLDFRAALFTNLTRDHLDYHGGMEDYRAAKSLLFRGLSAEAHAVFNADDPASSVLRESCAAAPCFYGMAESADFRAEDARGDGSGTRFTLAHGGERCEVALSLPGRYNVYNALAALACAGAIGIPLPLAASSLENVSVPGRMEPIREGQPFSVLVDYAHTPDGLENALRTLRESAGKRLILVFGCGGDRDVGKREIMGAIAARYADRTWVTSDNPRSEKPEDIAGRIVRGMAGADYRLVLDRDQAIGEAIADAEPGDIVLIAGKGHETVQTVGARTVHFDDRETARRHLKNSR